MNKFIGIIKDSSLMISKPELRRIKDHVSKFKDDSIIELIIRKVRSKRSIKQNRYKWAVVVESFYHFLRDMGHEDIETRDDANLWLRQRFNSKKIWVLNEQIEVAMPFNKLSTADFEKKMEKIRMFAAQWGLNIPEPREGENAIKRDQKELYGVIDSQGATLESRKVFNID